MLGLKFTTTRLALLHVRAPFLTPESIAESRYGRKLCLQVALRLDSVLTTRACCFCAMEELNLPNSQNEY
jgi:hypothetical protein